MPIHSLMLTKHSRTLPTHIIQYTTKKTLTIIKLELWRLSVFRSTKTWSEASNTCQYEPRSWKVQRTMRWSGVRRKLSFQHLTSTSIFRNQLLSVGELQPCASETKNIYMAACQNTACQYAVHLDRLRLQETLKETEQTSHTVVTCRNR